MNKKSFFFSFFFFENFILLLVDVANKSFIYFNYFNIFF